MMNGELLQIISHLYYSYIQYNFKNFIKFITLKTDK